MARSSVEVTRVEVLLPPPVAEAVKKAAKRDGMGVGTWVAAQSAKAAGVEYVPPPRGRKPKGDPPAEKPKRGKKK